MAGVAVRTTVTAQGDQCALEEQESHTGLAEDTGKQWQGNPQKWFSSNRERTVINGVWSLRPE